MPGSEPSPYPEKAVSTPTTSLAPLVARLLQRARVDFPARPAPPRTRAVVLATAVAALLSLAADTGLVAVGHAAFPATTHYSHFAFWDYGSLTVLGVAAAGAAWAGVARISSEPRWLLGRLAVVVSAVLLLPDLWLVGDHNPIGGVGILMSMHLVIAVITFVALVTLAPAGRPGPADTPGSPAPTLPRRAPEPTHQLAPTGPSGRLFEGRVLWTALLAGVLVELGLGAAALFVAPLGRPTGLVPHRGQLAYLLHAVIGIVLAGLALWAWSASRRLPSTGRHRDRRLGASLGLVGLLLAGLGGAATVVHGSLRVVGLGLMLLGTVTALLAYSLPLVGPALDPTQLLVATADHSRPAAPAPTPASDVERDASATGSTNQDTTATVGPTEPAASTLPPGWALAAPSPRQLRKAARRAQRPS